MHVNAEFNMYLCVLRRLATCRIRKLHVHVCNVSFLKIYNSAALLPWLTKYINMLVSYSVLCICSKAQAEHNSVLACT